MERSPCHVSAGWLNFNNCGWIKKLLVTLLISEFQWCITMSLCEWEIWKYKQHLDFECNFFFSSALNPKVFWFSNHRIQHAFELEPSKTLIGFEFTNKIKNGFELRIFRSKLDLNLNSKNKIQTGLELNLNRKQIPNWVWIQNGLELKKLKSKWIWTQK